MGERMRGEGEGEGGTMFAMREKREEEINLKLRM